ncbi:ABC transporter ATP-binding protein [Candidatus Aerophobetes bacterium]|uniref:ABC transporter ATP-binding protein n=1 Tax=Aerophobetes bacterium TaxID=2030807 RepID=A0A2A4YKZ6_UNCAE|nr:MAG: ABC transporter ATP-binding protein [Candidatus Aerophobetes bacterium]
MLSLLNLKLAFGSRTLFADVNLKLTARTRYGLVGANGSGKTTFLKVLSLDLEPSSGEIVKPKNATIGILSQDYYKLESNRVLDVVIMGKKRLWDAMHEKDEILQNEELSERDIERLGFCEEIIDAEDGYEAESIVAELLEGLGIENSKHESDLKTLSGGYKMRVMLAQLLYINPSILLLDEPTNYLDILSIRWLEGYLKDFAGTVIICSHDRFFLNQVCTHMMDVDYGTITMYTGDYDDFIYQKKDALLQKEASVGNIEKKQKHLQNFIDRYGAKATKAKQAKSKFKASQRLEDEKKTHMLEPSSRSFPSFRFSVSKRSAAVPLVIDGISKSFGKNKVLEKVSFEVEKGEKIAIVGANGIGKSTLLEIVTDHLEADNGTSLFKESAQVAYFPQYFERELDKTKTVLSCLADKHPDVGEQKLRSTLGLMLFHSDEMGKKVLQLSGGEKSRLVFASLMLDRQNFLILDEPTNHLDLESSESLMKALQEYDGTLLMVSHDRYFISNVATRIIELRSDGYFDFLGTYDEYVEKRKLDYLDRNLSADKKNKKVEKVSDPEKKQPDTACKKKLNSIEKTCQKLEKELQDLQEVISSESFYQNTPDEERVTILKKQKEIENKLKVSYQKWEQLMS